MGTTVAAELVETGEKHDRRGRRITPAGRREEMVRAYRASGLTQAAFARREGIKYQTFTIWVQASGRRARSPAVRFAEVRLPLAVAKPVMLEVQLPCGAIARGANAAELAQLVRAMRS
jgi:transposase-like protein